MKKIGEEREMNMSQKFITQELLSYIHEHLDEALSMDEIAKKFNYSKFYIARVFKEETGSTLYKYIQNKRLEKAAISLVETNKPIIEIAYEAQYSSPQAFTLAFRQEYSCSPQIYRKRYALLLESKTSISQKVISHLSHYTIEGRMAA